MKKILFMGASRVGLMAARALLGAGVRLSAVASTPRTVVLPGSSTPVNLSTYVDFESFAGSHGLAYHACRDAWQDLDRCLDAVRPDLALVVGWYHKVPKQLLEKVPGGMFLVHASLLPRYRGGAPLVWQMARGETEAGATLFRMNARIDAGDVFGTVRFPIHRADTIATLLERSEQNVCGLVASVFPKIVSGDLAVGVPQDESRATVVPLRRPEDGGFGWSHPAESLYNWIRSQTRPYPGAFTSCRGRRLYAWRSEVREGVAGPEAPGTVLTVGPDGLLVRAGDAPRALCLAEVGPASGEPSVPAAELAREWGLACGDRLAFPEGAGKHALPG